MQQPKSGLGRLLLRLLDHIQLEKHTQTPWDSSEPAIKHSAEAATCTKHTTYTRNEHPCRQGDSNPRFQKSRGCRSI